MQMPNTPIFHLEISFKLLAVRRVIVTEREEGGAEPSSSPRRRLGARDGGHGDGGRGADGRP